MFPCRPSSKNSHGSLPRVSGGGSHGWKTDPLADATGTPRKSTLDGIVHYEDWAKRREALARQLERYPVPGSKIPPRYPVDVPEGRDQKVATLKAKEWNHILFSDKNGGGHLSGYGWINNGTEFDPAWGYAHVLEAMTETALRGRIAENGLSAVHTVGPDQFIVRYGIRGRHLLIVSLFRFAQ